VAELDPGVVGGELPVDLALVGVRGVLPGGEFGVEDVEVVDAAVEALPGQYRKLDLGDVEPRSVFRGVVDLQPAGPARTPCPVRRPRTARRCRGC